VELLEKLLRDEIKARARNNVVQEKKYGDRLLETLRKYHNRAIETAQVIEELIQMAKEFQAVLEREAALGLGHDEIAFYDALANNESAVRELGDEVLKKIARRDHGEAAYQHHGGLAGARECSRQVAHPGSPHASEVEIPAGQAT
jgi:type I site-specific restriction-modification system R (restriction) subunit